VTTAFFADSQSAEAAIARLEAKYLRLENATKALSRKTRDETTAAAQAVEQWATSVGTLAATYVGLGTVLSQVWQSQQEINRRADEGILKYDELNRRLRVQGGLTALQGQQAQERLTQIALRTGVDYQTAARGAEELVSQGFSAEQGTGTALERLLQTMQSTNARPEDIKLLAQSYSALLAGTGQEKNTASLEDVSRAVQRTFKGTPLQAPDLMALAPKIQGVAQAVPWQEALAQFAVMREKATPDVAATSLKLFWERLQTASGTKSSEEALAKLGLTAEQVDAIGEKPAEVLDSLCLRICSAKRRWPPRRGCCETGRRCRNTWPCRGTRPVSNKTSRSGQLVRLPPAPARNCCKSSRCSPATLTSRKCSPPPRACNGRQEFPNGC